MDLLWRAFVVLGAGIAWVFLSFLGNTPYAPLPPVPSPVKEFVHTKENSEDVHVILDTESRLVQIETVDSKVAIVIDPGKDSFSKFRDGIGVASFQCANKFGGDCPFTEPYELYVNKGLVKAVFWQFQREKQDFKTAIVHHGPGDGDFKKDQIIVDIINGDLGGVYMHFRIADTRLMKLVSGISRDDLIKVILPEEEPYNAYVNGVKMDIVALAFFSPNERLN